MTKKFNPRKPQLSYNRRKKEDASTAEHWLFGLHAVRDALANPERIKHKLIVTPNARLKLEGVIAESGIQPEISDPRKFHAPLAAESVHQGAALHTEPLVWGTLEEFCKPHKGDPTPIAMLLDRISDPHNVGAILRSAHAFGARAVIAPKRHAAPETGALAKAASGALEKQPYLRINNLSEAMDDLKQMGYTIYGLDADAPKSLSECNFTGPTAFAMGSEGPGLRPKTLETCSELVNIPTQDDFSSLNVSNAAAISLYAASVILET